MSCALLAWARLGRLCLVALGRVGPGCTGVDWSVSAGLGWAQLERTRLCKTHLFLGGLGQDELDWLDGVLKCGGLSRNGLGRTRMA